LSKEKQRNTLLQRISEIEDRIKNLEERIKKMEKKSFLSAEDQLFFSVVFSLLIVFVTLPFNQLASLLEQVFGFSQSLALLIAERIKIVGIVSMLFSSITRYCGAVSGENSSKRFRFYSVFSFVIGFDILLLMVVTSAFPFEILVFSEKGASWQLYTKLTIPLGSLILIPVYIAVIYLEKKILIFYKSKDLILKKHANIMASPTFLAISIGTCLNLTIVVLVMKIFHNSIPYALNLFIYACCVVLISYVIYSRIIEKLP